jgi:hypothetical protein
VKAAVFKEPTTRVLQRIEEEGGALFGEVEI